jgi:hypothetical protein
MPVRLPRVYVPALFLKTVGCILHASRVPPSPHSTLHTCCTWAQDGKLARPIELWSSDLMFGLRVMKASSTNHVSILEVDSTNRATWMLNGVAHTVPEGVWSSRHF